MPLYYKFYGEKTTFSVAKTKCEDAGGRIARISNSEEWTASKAFAQDIWIGIVKVSGNLKWSDGTPVTFS